MDCIRPTLRQALHPYERVKVVQLLIEHVHYNAEADELTIIFWAEGLKPSAEGAVA